MKRWMLMAGVAIEFVAQDRLKTMPGYEQNQTLSTQIPTAIKSGALAVTWTADSRGIDYSRDAKRFRYDVTAHRTTELAADDTASGRGRGSDRAGGPPAAQPERGRQFESEASPDGAWKASYRDRNLWLSRSGDGNAETAITSDGSVATRVKYATASWVYGEELNQRTAMWWSPDSRR